jgi:hypothetical protein
VVRGPTGGYEAFEPEPESEPLPPIRPIEPATTGSQPPED